MAVEIEREVLEKSELHKAGHQGPIHKQPASPPLRPVSLPGQGAPTPDTGRSKNLVSVPRGLGF